MGAADLQIYIDSSTGGDTTGQGMCLALPLQRTMSSGQGYCRWYRLKVNGFTGWSDVSCSNLQEYIGHSGDTDTEITIMGLYRTA